MPALSFHGVKPKALLQRSQEISYAVSLTRLTEPDGYVICLEF